MRPHCVVLGTANENPSRVWVLIACRVPCCVWYLSHDTSERFSAADTVVILILQMRTRRPREVTSLVQGHTGSECRAKVGTPEPTILFSPNRSEL